MNLPNERDRIGFWFPAIDATLSTTLYIFLSTRLWSWLIDDAGISFAYARSIAHGAGMVSQPGMPPVEGISNPLWTFLSVPAFWFALQDLAVYAKLLGILFFFIGIWHLLRVTVRLSQGSHWPAITLAAVLGLSAPIVIWFSSGLENSLYFALTGALVWQVVRWYDRELSHWPSPLLIGILTAAIALTRPEGMLWIGFFPALLAVALILGDRLHLRQAAKSIWHYSVAVTAIFGSYLLFRIAYFGEWVPNTYYIKGGETNTRFMQMLILEKDYLLKLRDLSGQFWGRDGWHLVPVALIVFVTFALIVRKDRLPKLAVAGAAILTIGSYLLTVNDWMGEYRLATGAIPFVVLVVVLFFREALERTTEIHALRSLFGVAFGSLLIAMTWNLHEPRITAFAKARPVNYHGVAERFGTTFNHYAEVFELSDASFLVPDVGGTLMTSRLRIHDLAGLCDKTIATSRGKDQKRFFAYIFDTLKPTFIHTHGYFTSVSKFDDDPRFERDYVDINESVDEYVRKTAKVDRKSGDFIRRDAIVGRESRLDSLRAGMLDPRASEKNALSVLPGERK